MACCVISCLCWNVDAMAIYDVKAGVPRRPHSSLLGFKMKTLGTSALKGWHEKKMDFKFLQQLD